MPEINPTDQNSNLSSADILMEQMNKIVKDYNDGAIDLDDAIEEVRNLYPDLMFCDGISPSIYQSADKLLEQLNDHTTKNSGIFSKLKQIFRDLRGKSETFEKKDLLTEHEKLKQLKKDALLAAIPYKETILSDGNNDLSIDHNLTQELMTSLDNSLNMGEDTKKSWRHGDIPNQNNSDRYPPSFIDSRSGFAAYVLVDKNNKQVNIIFGGTTAGSYRNTAQDNYPFLKRNLYNAIATLSQWVSNIKVGLGVKPHSLIQASNLTRKVLEAVNNSEALKQYTVRTIGHSKGAAEAVYAALAQKEPLTAVGFSSADLSGGLVRGLPKENVIQAKRLITHFHVKSDLVPNLRFITPSLRPLGVEIVIPAQSSFTSPLHRHTDFDDHIKSWVDEKISASVDEEV